MYKLKVQDIMMYIFLVWFAENDCGHNQSGAAALGSRGRRRRTWWCCSWLKTSQPEGLKLKNTYSLENPLCSPKDTHSRFQAIRFALLSSSAVLFAFCCRQQTPTRFFPWCHSGAAGSADVVGGCLTCLLQVCSQCEGYSSWLLHLYCFCLYFGASSNIPNARGYAVGGTGAENQWSFPVWPDRWVYYIMWPRCDRWQAYVEVTCEIQNPCALNSACESLLLWSSLCCWW